MNTFFAGNGFRIVDRASIPEEDKTFSNAWGICDEDLLNASLREADAAYATGKPFYQFVLTTSNHRPFTYPDGKVDIPSGTSRSGAIKYTDYAIGNFMRKAERRPWFRDTIFVIVADHTAGSAARRSSPQNATPFPASFTVQRTSSLVRWIRCAVRLISRLPFSPCSAGVTDRNSSAEIF